MKTRSLTNNSGIHQAWIINCPGCSMSHSFDKRWSFNGNVEKPTFKPSLLVKFPANPKAIEEFKEWRAERICHSFVTDGKIIFLNDCTHELKGQTVDLPSI